LVVPIGTSYFSLRHEQKVVRKEVKRMIIAGLDKKQLVLIKLTSAEKKDQLRWKHSKEFEYKGQMYDIVEKEFKDSLTYYWCWWDHEETSLNKKLNQLAADAFNNSDRKQQQEKKLSSFYQSLYLNEVSTDVVWIDFEEEVEFQLSKGVFFPNPSNPPHSPPPKLS
jgi:ribonuclease HI